MELKKSYTGFVLWMICFVALMFLIVLIPSEDFQLPMRLIMLLMSWGVASMAFIIWRTEYVYWYNGTTYEEAVAAGHERRRAFAWLHLKVFVRFALLMTAVSCLTCLMEWSAWIDFVFGTVGLIVTACCTIPFKL